jgi:hypothetical protein
VPRALYLHAVVHEYAHTHLCRLAAQAAISARAAA